MGPASEIPEPSTVGFLSFAGLGAFLFLRKRSKKAAKNNGFRKSYSPGPGRGSFIQESVPRDWIHSAWDCFTSPQTYSQRLRIPGSAIR